jgi:broad specificity phosphatase PhoE
MTRFYLARHGDNEFVMRGAIAGRLPNVQLNETGRTQAERLAALLAQSGAQHLFSSPLLRCMETAAPIAKRLGIEIQAVDELLELDFGDWTGRLFSELEPLEHWRRYNLARSITRIPGGELMLEVQSRVVALFQKIQSQYPNDAVCIVSHGDVLRAAVMYYLGIPLDFVHRLRLDVGSLSIISLLPDGVEIESMNQTP